MECGGCWHGERISGQGRGTRTGYHWFLQSYPLPLAFALSVKSVSARAASGAGGAATAALRTTCCRGAAEQLHRRVSARHAAPGRDPCQRLAVTASSRQAVKLW